MARSKHVHKLLPYSDLSFHKDLHLHVKETSSTSSMFSQHVLQNFIVLHLYWWIIEPKEALWVSPQSMSVCKNGLLEIMKIWICILNKNTQLSFLYIHVMHYVLYLSKLVITASWLSSSRGPTFCFLRWLLVYFAFLVCISCNIIHVHAPFVILWIFM